MKLRILSLACAALGACSPTTKPPAATPQPAQQVFDDQALRTRFESRMAELVAKGGATPQSKLREQLSRKSCTLELPEPGTTTLSPAEIYQQRLHAVVMIAKLFHCSSASCKKVHANIASGVILREDGIVLTNHHVVDGKQAKGLGMGVMTADGKAFLVDEVLAASAEADVAILRLKNASGLAHAPVLAEEPVGNAVTLISHPAGNFFSLSHGRIARYRKDDDGACTMQITADYAKGSSGGPIFNDRGDIVGLVSNTVSIPYRQLPVAIDPESKSLEAAGKNNPPAQVNGMPLVMDMNHQMTFKNAVASREVLALIKRKTRSNGSDSTR